jgi:hypothetical protein
VSSSSHRGDRKILVPLKSYSGDVIPTAFLNAAGKHLPSSQEKQGDDQLRRARDIVSSEVRSEVAGNDLELSTSETDEDEAVASSIASSNDSLSTPPPSRKKPKPKKPRRPTYDAAPMASGQVTEDKITLCEDPFSLRCIAANVRQAMGR